MYAAVLAALIVSAVSCSHTGHGQYRSAGRIDYSLTDDDVAMLDSIQQKSFLFFKEKHHPRWGIVKDRAVDWAPASIASTGFGIPVFATGAERGWITREEAARITLNILKFFAMSEQSDDPDASGYRGFYYHFLTMDSGRREWQCELSSVDTGLLMMGIIFARNYYNLDNDTEAEIRTLAGRLLERIDWEFMMMPDTGSYAGTISMGWTPEEGMHAMGWKGYNEALFLYILAAGSGLKDAPERYDAWLSSYRWYTHYEGIEHAAFPPLFGHQFSHIFIDFRGLADKYMRDKGIDYFENSRRATLSQRNYAVDNPYGRTGYDSLCWGITASDGPGGEYNRDTLRFHAYAGRGATGPDLNYFDDGTIAPYGPLSSLPFAPGTVLPTIRNINAKYGDKIWGRYGYYDSFNPTAGWVDDDFIGIDQGPLLLMIENFRTGLVWNYVMQDPLIGKGLSRLGFKYL